MRAVQLRRAGGRPELHEIAAPEPGPGQVVLRVTAAGLCHSDLSVMGLSADQLRYPLPQTLGHEGVGLVSAVGTGVTAVSEGDQVAVHLAWGCGHCLQCREGQENYCAEIARHGLIGPGLGRPGALADHLLVDDVRRLVPAPGLDPVRTVPLTDAGLTPYHAVRRVLPRLFAGSTTVVIGVGGLGHLAIQILRAITPTRVVALDVSPERLAMARELGAHEVLLSDDAAAPWIRELTDGAGAEVVLDFVGTRATSATAARSVAANGEISVVGIGGGHLEVGFGRLPYGTVVSLPFGGSRGDLVEVLDLARDGALRTHVQAFSLEDTPHAYDLLHAGRIEGRAVVVP